MSGENEPTKPTNEPNEPTNEPGKPGDGGGAGGKGGERTFTQAEVTEIAAREKNQGKAAAEKAIAEQLGVSLDEAKAILKQHKEAEDAKKSEAEKAAEAARKEKEAAEAEKAAAAREVFETRLERAFLKEGLELDDDKKLARVRRMVSVEPGASYEDVLKDVQAIKSDFPALFEGEPDDGERRRPSGDPKGRPPRRTGGEDSYSRGKERAQRHRGTYTARVEKKD